MSDAESGVSFFALHRAELHRVLREALVPEHVVTGSEVRSVRSDTDAARVSYVRHGSERELVADGASLVEHDVPSALERYDRQRRPRTQRVVRRSRLAGRIAHPGNSWASTARNALLRSIPHRAGIVAGAVAARWEPPRLPSV